MKSRVHPKYKANYRVTNWPPCDRSLVQRGDITIPPGTRVPALSTKRPSTSIHSPGSSSRTNVEFGQVAQPGIEGRSSNSCCQACASASSARGRAARAA